MIFAVVAAALAVGLFVGAVLLWLRRLGDRALARSLAPTPPEEPKPRVRADEGTRTLDLLHGKQTL